MRRAVEIRRVLRFAAAVGLGLLISSCATSEKAPRKQKPGEDLAPKAFFWEAQSENGARLFLLGSVHIGDGRELVLDPRIEADWKQSQELVVELDTTTLSPIDAVDATNRFGLLPRGTLLRNVVKPDTYKQVARYMKQRDYPIERIDRMRPWLVAQVVTQLEYAAAGLEAENGVDVAMMRRATGNRGIVPLESLDEQAALFAGLPAPLQEKMLVEILREAQALLAVTRATLDAWEQGDEATLSSLLFGNASGDPELTEFYERVFYGRNRAMADRLVTLSADGRPRFVVVGTGHLIGPQGIPELLAQRGFRVERVGSARVIPGMTAETIPPPGAAKPAVRAVQRPAPVPVTTTIAPPAPSGPTAPAAASDTLPSTPLPELPGAAPARPQPTAQPTAPARSPGAPSDAWLTQDAAPAPGSEPLPSAIESIPAPPSAAPAPVVEPVPAPTPTPAPTTPKPKRRLLRPPGR